MRQIVFVFRDTGSGTASRFQQICYKVIWATLRRKTYPLQVASDSTSLTKVNERSGGVPLVGHQAPSSALAITVAHKVPIFRFCNLSIPGESKGDYIIL